MPKTLSSVEAKNRLGALIAWAVTNQDEVIVEHHGKPRAVIMAYDEYERVKEFRQQSRRQEILARLDRLRQEVSERNADLTEDEALALADQVARQAIDTMVAEGRLRFR